MPAGIVEIRELLRGLASTRGVTVFMSSHILAEVAQLADRIGIIHEGPLLEDLDIRDFRAHSHGYLEVQMPKLAPEVARTVVEAGLDLHSLTPMVGREQEGGEDRVGPHLNGTRQEVEGDELREGQVVLCIRSRGPHSPSSYFARTGSPSVLDP